MKVIETEIAELVLLKPTIYSDQRGYFFEPYNEKVFTASLKSVNFIQDNESLSAYGTIRGLHFQRAPFEQTKLVRVVKGKVLDVAVDLRPDSETFGKHFSIILDDVDKVQMLIPRGFAHGFAVLSDEAVFSYKVDNYYSKDHELSVLYNDSELNIDWILTPDQVIVSQKDLMAKTLNQLILEGSLSSGI